MKNRILGSPILLIYANILVFYVLVGLSLRLLLLCRPPEGVVASALMIVKSLLLGIFNDLCMGCILSVPILLICLGFHNWKYKRYVGWTIIVLLAIAFIYSSTAQSVFRQYGGGAPTIAMIILGYKLISFSLRLFIPKIREAWRRVSLYVLWEVYVFLILFISIGEWFFWEEFGVRFNFIAVDYLVYTHEVIGNIWESYSIIPIFFVVLIISLSFVLFSARFFRTTFYQPYIFRSQTKQALLIICFSLISVMWFRHTVSVFESENMFANQLQQNGAYSFLLAFHNKEIDYEKFYSLLPKEECVQTYLSLTDMANRHHSDSIGSEWQDVMTGTHDKANIVLITVESLSASFLSKYGNTQDITPCLDTLMIHSLVFDSMYAVGNRTVRGLEALSLGIPPSAGESVMKRPHNMFEGMTLGNLLSRHGYSVQFLYGGDSYFDNMGDFFGKNGYEVIDRGQIDDVSFSNIWGVCDEDLYRKAITVMDAKKQQEKPFFVHMMTVSNHRPYTFPDGTVSLPNGNLHSRDGAVKYTDYAIGQFLNEASRHDWFDNTLFVIVADHCASSAGKTSIPIDKYHIPCIIYSPSLLRPANVRKICSQIDVIPTLLALLNIKDSTSFTGQNILSDRFRPRAFMATYQDLGYLENHILSVLSPNKKVTQYKIETLSNGKHSEELLPRIYADTLLLKTIAFYQYTHLIIEK